MLAQTSWVSEGLNRTASFEIPAGLHPNPGLIKLKGLESHRMPVLRRLTHADLSLARHYITFCNGRRRAHIGLHFQRVTGSTEVHEKLKTSGLIQHIKILSGNEGNG